MFAIGHFIPTSMLLVGDIYFREEFFKEFRTLK